MVLFTPETLDQVNQVVVKAGHELIRKSQQKEDQVVPVETAPEDKLSGRCDSFVVETKVEYPTDTR